MGELRKMYINEINKTKRRFLIPSYQRGYRWGKENVKRLLDDLYEDLLVNKRESYCLQPVVVKRNVNGDYELVDGQQRLTTIYLLSTFLLRGEDAALPFTMTYKTRKDSETFLKNISSEKTEKKEDNIDFYFISEAWQTIEEWFKGCDKVDIESFYSRFSEKVFVIWYEVDQEDPIELFKRLNIGKIPLTNAELVKAMFLSMDGQQLSPEEQREIAIQWDWIERELWNDRFWYFLAGSDGKRYQTRIDLVLDLMVEGKENEPRRDVYSTYFYFEDRRQELKKGHKSIMPLWKEIQSCFLRLKGWYEDYELYHKIGYLIASQFKVKETGLKALFNLSKGKTKPAFKEALNCLIKDSVSAEGGIASLSYEKNYDAIQRILLLFNVESVRRIGDQSQRFPFDLYNHGKNGKPAWSLEHIHAQNTAAVGNAEKQKEWLEKHKESLERLNGFGEMSERTDVCNQLIQEIDDVLQDNSFTEKFEDLRIRVIKCLSENNEMEYIHTLDNMALLTVEDNASLNNDAFDVKRKRIIEMDQKGKFIPYCTKMVFLKYYSPGDDSPHFWTHTNREEYVATIRRVLEKYLPPEDTDGKGANS